MTNSPNQTAKLKLGSWILGIFLILAGLLAWKLHGPQTTDLPVLGTLPKFHLQNQEGRPVDQSYFLGRVSVANFIFTLCPDVCPLLTAQMQKIQKRAEELQIPVNLVSISVDPENDTPAVLKEYAHKHGADLTNWAFLTGPLQDIESIIVQGFKVGLDRSATDIFDITHTEHFVIVDTAGQIRGYRRAPNMAEIDKILADVTFLWKAPPSTATSSPTFTR